MNKVIIFDFDGVIADTADILFALSRDFDPTISEEDFRAHHDGNVHEEPRIQFTSEGLQRLHEEYYGRLDVSHIENAIKPIKRLSNAYRLFIISSNEERGIHSVLENVEMKDCFEAIYGYDTHKSKIVKFEMIRDKFNVKLENAIFITDTLGDIKEAKKLNIPTIAVTFGFHNREHLEQGEPHVVVDTWEQIEAEIEKMK